MPKLLSSSRQARSHFGKKKKKNPPHFFFFFFRKPPNFSTLAACSKAIQVITPPLPPWPNSLPGASPSAAGSEGDSAHPTSAWVLRMWYLTPLSELNSFGHSRQQYFPTRWSPCKAWGRPAPRYWTPTPTLGRQEAPDPTREPWPSPRTYVAIGPGQPQLIRMGAQGVSFRDPSRLLCGGISELPLLQVR